MPRPRKEANYFSVIDLQILFKKHLGINIQRSTVYHYVKNLGFPNNTGWGRPRRWEREKVMKWFAKNKTL